jgi:hypothetical protein
MELALGQNVEFRESARNARPGSLSTRGIVFGLAFIALILGPITALPPFLGLITFWRFGVLASKQ